MSVKVTVSHEKVEDFDRRARAAWRILVQDAERKAKAQNQKKPEKRTGK